MPTATVTSKGQITIPVELRQELRLDAGDRVEFVRNQRTGRYEIIPATVGVEALKGIIPKPKKPVSLEEMSEAIRRRRQYSR